MVTPLPLSFSPTHIIRRGGGGLFWFCFGSCEPKHINEDRAERRAEDEECERTALDSQVDELRAVLRRSRDAIEAIRLCDVEAARPHEQDQAPYPSAVILGPSAVIPGPAAAAAAVAVTDTVTRSGGRGSGEFCAAADGPELLSSAAFAVPFVAASKADHAGEYYPNLSSPSKSTRMFVGRGAGVVTRAGVKVNGEGVAALVGGNDQQLVRGVSLAVGGLDDFVDGVYGSGGSVGGGSGGDGGRVGYSGRFSDARKESPRAGLWHYQPTSAGFFRRRRGGGNVWSPSAAVALQVDSSRRERQRQQLLQQQQVMAFHHGGEWATRDLNESDGGRRRRSTRRNRSMRRPRVVDYGERDGCSGEFGKKIGGGVSLWERGKELTKATGPAVAAAGHHWSDGDVTNRDYGGRDDHAAGRSGRGGRKETKTPRRPRSYDNGDGDPDGSSADMLAVTSSSPTPTEHAYFRSYGRRRGEEEESPEVYYSSVKDDRDRERRRRRRGVVSREGERLYDREEEAHHRRSRHRSSSHGRGRRKNGLSKSPTSVVMTATAGGARETRAAVSAAAAAERLLLAEEREKVEAERARLLEREVAREEERRGEREVRPTDRPTYLSTYGH